MTTSSEEKRERRRYCTTRKATKRARHARAVVAITRKSGSKTGRKEKSRAVFFSFGELKVTDKQTESKGHLFPWQSPVKYGVLPRTLFGGNSWTRADHFSRSRAYAHTVRL